MEPVLLEGQSAAPPAGRVSVWQGQAVSAGRRGKGSLHGVGMPGRGSIGLIDVDMAGSATHSALHGKVSIDALHAPCPPVFRSRRVDPASQPSAAADYCGPRIK